MTRDELDAVNAWLAAAQAARLTCINADDLDVLILTQQDRRDAIEERLHDQWCASNGLDVVHS